MSSTAPSSTLKDVAAAANDGITMAAALASGNPEAIVNAVEAFVADAGRAAEDIVADIKDLIGQYRQRQAQADYDAGAQIVAQEDQDAAALQALGPSSPAQSPASTPSK